MLLVEAAKHFPGAPKRVVETTDQAVVPVVLRDTASQPVVLKRYRITGLIWHGNVLQYLESNRVHPILWNHVAGKRTADVLRV
jgi:hypothetical protein